MTIIIVNWNAGRFLAECLYSLFSKKMEISNEVIIIDNASTDNSVDIVKNEFTNVMLIQNKDNIGFTKANNQGIRLASGEYILLLNPDTKVMDNAIFKEWTDFMDKHPEAGASGCKLIYSDGTHQVGDAGFKPTLKTAFNYSFFLARYFPTFFKGLYLNYKTLTNPIEVDWICGADFLIRKSIIERVGVMNEEIFMYADDIEWGCRIRSYGYKIYYIPYLEIIHYQGISLSKQQKSARYSFTWYENLRQVYNAYSKKQSTFIFDSIFSMAFLLRAIIYYFNFLKTKDSLIKEKSEKMYTYFKFVLGLR